MPRPPSAAACRRGRTGSLRLLHPGGSRSLLVVLFALGMLVLGAPPASAHIGGGAAGSNFDGRVTAITPPAPGLSVRVLQFGDEVELVNGTCQEVLVPGYSDEPYLRIGPDGVYRNANSPASHLNLNRYATLPLPPMPTRQPSLTGSSCPPNRTTSGTTTGRTG